MRAIYCSNLADCKEYFFYIKKLKENFSTSTDADIPLVHLSLFYTDLEQRRDLHGGNYVLDAGAHSITINFLSWYIVLLEEFFLGMYNNGVKKQNNNILLIAL
jgi:hypothetical protein